MKENKICGQQIAVFNVTMTHADFRINKNKENSKMSRANSGNLKNLKKQTEIRSMISLAFFSFSFSSPAIENS